MLSRLETPLLVLASLAYFGAMLVFWARLFLSPKASGRLPAHVGGSWFFALGASLHLISLAGQGPDLFRVRAGVVGLFGWLLVVSFLVGGRRVGVAGGAALAPMALCATLFSLATPALQGWTPTDRPGALWLVIHVFVIVSAYVSLAFAFVFALLGLAQEKLLKGRQLTGLWQRLPSLSIADEWIFRASALGFALLTLGLSTGIALGAVQSHNALRDPKTIFSLLTWTIFAGYLAARTQLGWRGRRSHLFVVYGFVVLAFSFFGVPHLVSQ